MTISSSFGKTGLSIPRVIFGATTLGNLFVAPSDQQKRDLIQSWVEHSGDTVVIDTAGKYGAGLSLEVLGRVLADLQVDPARVMISNKLAWRRIPLTTSEPTFEPGAWIDLKHDAVQDISYDGILRCHEDGCRLLGDYKPQLLAIHDPDEYLAAAKNSSERSQRMEDIVGACRALAELRDHGQIAGVGVGIKDWKVLQELDRLIDFDWVMIANSFTIMNHPPELVEFITSLASRHIGVINSAVTHGGFLVGGDHYNYQKIDRGNADDRNRLEFRDRLGVVCERHGVSVFEVAVAFAGSHPGVHSLALSSSRPERTESLVHTANQVLSADLWSDLLESGLMREDYPFRSPGGTKG